MVLEQIFVELAVDSTFPHKHDKFVEEEPQQELPKRLREGPHNVWEYISIQKTEQKMEIKPRLVILGPRCHPELCVKISSKQGDKEARAKQRT